MRNGHTFTLLEFVVIIAIIVVLAAMLLPVLTHRPPRGSRKAACKSNLKQIGLLCKMYSSDYDESWPYAETKGNNARQNLFLLFETHLATDRQIFLCPSSNSKKLPEITAPADMAKSDYAYIDGPPEAYNDGKLSGVVSGDAWEGHSDPSHDTWTHPSGTNTLWVDGHVEWRTNEYVGVNGPYTNVK